MKTILKDNFYEFIERLLENYKVIAPVKKEKGVLFSFVSDPNDIDLIYRGHTLLSPKRFFLPEKEVLFTYEKNGNGVTIYDKCEEVEASKRVLVGIHPCDIQGLIYLDKVFIKDFNDPYYIARRKNTLIIGLTCREPADYCFCSYTGSGPMIRDGFDLMLTDLGDLYLVEIGSEEGERLIKFNLDLFEEASEDHIKERDRILKEVDAKIRRYKMASIDGIYDLMVEKFNDPLWDMYGEKCLSCGKCNYVCPTCRCFDIYEEPDYSLRSGKRVRVWDSCHFLSFTRVAGGKVFREERRSRIKQRVFHKYFYSIDEIGSISCVGCGRCIEVCPARIDIREIFNKVMNR